MTADGPAAAISDEARPRLPRGVRLRHDTVRDEWTLLAPERVFKADAIAVAILQRCNGETTLAALIDGLTAAFGAERARVDADVRTLLAGLAAKRMLDL